MNYKTRLILLFVGLFFVVLTSILSFVYASYAEFRRDEFFERLRQKSFNTAKLLIDVQEVDISLLKIIDQNSINKMYDEKILVFDKDNKLIYSSLDDETIPYSTKAIQQIRERDEKYYVDDDGDEVVGIHYTEGGQDYVVLASAFDRYGISKLENLRNLVIMALILGTILIGLASYFYIRQVFRPIDEMNLSIQNISASNLKEFIAVKKNRDELDKLAVNYNEMLSRLYKAFESQRAFVRNAAHELKTPLAVTRGKIERLEELSGDFDPKFKEIVSTLAGEIDEQAVLVESLLLIQRLQSQIPIDTSAIRIDEVLFETIREVNQVHPRHQVKIDIDHTISEEKQLTVKANTLLLKICFRNLVENAAVHAPHEVLKITIERFHQTLRLMFVNKGENPIPEDIAFEPFYRHTNERDKPGHGLGLSIIKQVVELMGGQTYYSYHDGEHSFEIKIPLLKI